MVGAVNLPSDTWISVCADLVLVPKAEPANFISECYFLTVYAMRLGPLKTMDLYLELMTQFSETQKAYQNLEESRVDWANVNISWINCRCRV